MNDALIIAGYVVLTAALMAGSFALGRWERRTVYTPGPPRPPYTEPPEIKEARERWEKALADFTESLEPTVARGSQEESVRLVPRYPTFLEEAQKVAGNVYAGRPWPPALPPPDIDHWSFPAAQMFWLDLLGDPTKKEAD